MAFNSTMTSLPGVLIINPVVYKDDRGFFFESFNHENFEKVIGSKVKFLQDNHSKSKRGVLRGLHYQVTPHAQGRKPNTQRNGWQR